GAFLAPCTSFLLTFRALKYWELSRVNMLKTTQPLFVLPMAYLVFGKIPGGITLFGGLLILIGALWLSWIHLRRSDIRETS
ncbi:MAG: EamA family transporter, partial [Theionarchaea archaeon]|nr:EamA family transporter [Theionarchaea archaeon]